MSSTEVSTSFESITYEVKESIGYITLNRPKVMNALNLRTIEELSAAFQAAQKDVSVKGIILTGAGDKAFIAGADIAELSAIDGDQAGEFSAKGQEVLSFIETLGKPMIAAVNGFALGGGCETAMACTIRVGAHEALRIGLVNEVVPAEDLLSRCECILKQIASNAPLAVRHSIDAVNEGMETDLISGLKLEAKYFALAASTEDRKEGTSAFVQKRAPQFQGR